MVRAENLVVMRIDGSEKGLFNDVRYTWRLNYSDGWLYYLNRDDNNKIYRVRTDNTQKTPINNESSLLINIVGDWIYYINSNEDDKCYRIRTDGSDRQMVE